MYTDARTEEEDGKGKVRGRKRGLAGTTFRLHACADTPPGRRRKGGKRRGRKKED